MPSGIAYDYLNELQVDEAVVALLQERRQMVKKTIRSARGNPQRDAASAFGDGLYTSFLFSQIGMAG
jgi:hypothetical protein